MPIQDNDNLIIGRSNDAYKISYSDFVDGLDVAAQPIAPSPGDGSESISPPVTGSGTFANPYVLTSEAETFGDTIESVETISFTGLKPYAPVVFEDLNNTTNGERFKQATGIIDASGTYTTKFRFSEIPSSTTQTTYTGFLKIGEIHYRWAVTVEPSLVVNKGVITPTANVFEDDELTGTANYSGTIGAPTITHIWEQDGVETRSTSNKYIAKEGVVRYAMEVQDTVTTIQGAWSNAVTVEANDSPRATMSGLRFDSERETKLFRPSDNSSSWTFSCWIKNTLTTGNGYILTT